MSYRRTLKPEPSLGEYLGFLGGLPATRVCGYSSSLQGTTPAEPKEAEGDIWIDPNATKTTQEIKETVTDSTTTIVVNN